jgi:hypothetical protein
MSEPKHGRTERKICEKIVRRGYNRPLVKWLPLDPQPCCANCKHGDCTIQEFIAFDTDLNKFYCSDWEVKK